MDLSIISVILGFQIVYCEDLKDLSVTELLKLGEDVSTIRLEDPKPNDVQFFFVDDANKIDNPQRIINSSWNSDKPIKLLVHGWLENHRRTWYKQIAQQYLKNTNANIIEVDWEKLARLPYATSARSTKFVGKQIADFIQKMHLDPKNVHIIGHSLGGHVAGFAGKSVIEATQQRIYRISGLDPAGPHFRVFLLEPAERLCNTDAEIVDVIHTDAGFYGYESPLGTLDIYVNGGKRIQPGCRQLASSPITIGNILENGFCSHSKSTQYFIEWIGNHTFNCRFRCEVKNKCSVEDADISLNYTALDDSIQGVCFTEYLA